MRNAEGKLKTFDVPSAGTGSYQGTGCPGCFLGLNQLGAIAGIYSDANSVNHGFLRSPDGKLTTFDAPGAGTGAFQGTGCSSDCPVSLNDFGAITGIYIDANFVFHGYLRSPEGRFVTVDPAARSTLSLSSINDSGSITGQYVDANNVWHGFYDSLRRAARSVSLGSRGESLQSVRPLTSIAVSGCGSAELLRTQSCAVASGGS